MQTKRYPLHVAWDVAGFTIKFPGRVKGSVEEMLRAVFLQQRLSTESASGKSSYSSGFW